MTRRLEGYGQRRRYGRVGRGRGAARRGRGMRVGVEKGDEEKLGAYECGFEPYDDARMQFNIRYYQRAMRFLVLDVEVAYRYPWVVSRRETEVRGYRVMREFRRELVVGYVYVWRVGVLEWD